MADYYPLIARAIDSLSDTSPEMRRAVFDRARSALIGQLRSLDPPLSEEDIQREQLSLDDAIERVEAERSSVSAEPAALPPVPFPDEARKPEASPRLKPEIRPDQVPAPAAQPASETRSAWPDGPRDDAAPPEPPPEAIRPRVESRSPKIRSEGRGRMALLGAMIVLVVGVIGYLAWIWRDQPEIGSPQTSVPEPQPQAATDGAKFNERVGGGPPTPPAGPLRSDVGVAQRAVLYEEDPTNPRAPKATAGRVTWRIDALNAGQGQPLETVVRAQVEVQEAGFTMTLLIRRNLDNTLPASHTAEIAFTTRPGESGRAIRDVGLLQFKDNFSIRGTPIAGQRITLGENLFVIGFLSSDAQRNADLMRRGWIDLPVLMASGQRAVLTFEKGTPGEQAMAEAWRQWQ